MWFMRGRVFSSTIAPKVEVIRILHGCGKQSFVVQIATRPGCTLTSFSSSSHGATRRGSSHQYLVQICSGVKPQQSRNFCHLRYLIDLEPGFAYTASHAITAIAPTCDNLYSESPLLFLNHALASHFVGAIDATLIQILILPAPASEHASALAARGLMRYRSRMMRAAPAVIPRHYIVENE